VPPPLATDGEAPPGIDVAIGVDRCVGCLECASVCRPEALRLMPGAWAVEVDVDRCTGCRRCVPACPFGAIAVTGQPRSRHQLVLDTLHSALSSTCPRGWTVTTTPPAFRSAVHAEPVTPDLAVVRSPRPGVEWLGREDALVSLAVEVVSPSTREADLGPKRDLYWQCGVTSYWIVDQRTGQVAVQWRRASDWFDRWAGFAFG
jgi:ferredoxin